jgi:hypothetical protein
MGSEKRRVRHNFSQLRFASRFGVRNFTLRPEHSFIVPVNGSSPLPPPRNLSGKNPNIIRKDVILNLPGLVDNDPGRVRMEPPLPNLSLHRAYDLCRDGGTPHAQLPSRPDSTSPVSRSSMMGTLTTHWRQKTSQRLESA